MKNKRKNSDEMELVKELYVDDGDDTELLGRILAWLAQERVEPTKPYPVGARLVVHVYLKEVCRVAGVSKRRRR